MATQPTQPRKGTRLLVIYHSSTYLLYAEPCAKFSQTRFHDTLHGAFDLISQVGGRAWGGQSLGQCVELRLEPLSILTSEI